ncbi:LysR family transcriptional regulator [Micromonospora andamanensis]|uniref:LysR family transcriptional regulator n=1 Tax=Micromonospora andamanensis TaxID=1287068 RepID=A0ABQ4HV79_9ACTN|nr:LysR family transcriptional regulator [Micromonospora andamanensis]GIJ09535.1 LysR family transcriptional regulator [Micromonospora andamanensis]
MDLVAACRAFVSVGSHGSFTVGAAVARIPQSVASRRVAALERHLGGRLFDRTSRSVTLTPFGRDMLASARRIVDLAEAMEHDAERARLRPFRLAVPEVCAPRSLARLVVEARRHDLNLELRRGEPAERARLRQQLEVRAALVCVPPDEAAWRVPLGLAGGADPGVETLRLETLRTPRADRRARRRRVWISPEDDVPHVRDPMTRLRDAVGLRPTQVAVAVSVVDAAADALAGSDLVLCSPAEAQELGLHWRPLAEPRPVRGYQVAAGAREDAERLRGELGAAVARCLGVPEAA